MLDELLLGGEIQETSKKNVLKAIAAQDLLQEVSFAIIKSIRGGFFLFLFVLQISGSGGEPIYQISSDFYFACVLSGISLKLRHPFFSL